MIDIKRFKTLVFDCDGVILDSNQVKTNAFYDVTLPYGEKAAQAFVDYHTSNGGISRYKKFAYFLEKIVPDVSPDKTGPSMDELLTAYADKVRHGLLTCQVASGLHELRRKTEARWLIVSGGAQEELREVFAERGLAELFDGGIFGSPDTKEEILARELGSNNIRQPALFLGDSKYDYAAANQAGLDFVFLSRWTEVEQAYSWCEENNILSLPDISSLC